MKSSQIAPFIPSQKMHDLAGIGAAHIEVVDVGGEEF